ncbi:MAG: tRNA (adenosine(37)-N6)-threonylcarbamoyltransferase complex ATPase subunit type 1 TsaE [Patescibacteria group bacterium]|nr:tRNA (adenosine(37)-N6)-threonylcarbamoyltransferase complex ATPase subunit type 1 TsaE [Patescibacteria group bacterium]
MKKIINSEQEMHAFAGNIAKKLRAGDVLALAGDLGSGKTTFVKGLARALGVKETVTSPTFVLLKPYQTKIQNPKSKIQNLIHVDAYRIEKGEELIFVGLDEFFESPDTVTVIEWADKVKKILPRGRTKWIKFSLGANPNQRIVVIP